MDEYALITYKEVRILLEIGNQNAFFPDSKVVRNLSYFPDYAEGLANLDGTISLVIDLSKFLDLNYHKDTKNLVLLQVKHGAGDFALKLPLPQIINEKINLKAANVKDDLTVKLPSSRYYAVGQNTFLVMSIDHFVDYLANELSDILYTSWLKTAPTWSQETLANAVQNTTYQSLKAPRKSDIVSSQGSAETKNILMVRISGYNFLIEERNVIDIIIEDSAVSHIPNSPKWIRGVINYQNDSLISIDLAAFLDIENDEKELDVDVVIEFEENRIVINAESVEALHLPDLNPVYTQDFTNETLPYSNIYSNTDGNVYYKLNLAGIIRSVIERDRPSLEWSYWLSFFQRTRNEYEETDKYLMGELASLNTLSAFVGNHHLLIPHENIELLTTDQEYKYYDGFRFTQYENHWIPSIDLSAWLDIPKSNLQYATIVAVGSEKFEIKCETAIMDHRDFTAMDRSKLEKVSPSSKLFGIDRFSSTKLGLGFDLNFEELHQQLARVKGVSGKTVSEITELMNSMFPIKVSEETATEVISGAWDKNSRLFLFTEVAQSKIAYPTSNITKFVLEPAVDEVIPWQYDKSSQGSFFVEIKDPNGGELTYEIPASSYLLAVAKDSIIKENEGEYISLNKERIPIHSFKNTGSD